MAGECTVNPVKDCLLEVFDTERAARDACEEHWASNRKARIVKTADVTAFRIRADGTPDPNNKLSVDTACFAVYSEG